MKFCQIYSQDILKILSGNEIYGILMSIKGHSSITNVGKIMRNNPRLEPINMNAHMNAYVKFGEILSICSQEFEWK